MENYFYFPPKNVLRGINVFHQAQIHHEAGHFLHRIVNPGIKEGVREFILTGERPIGHSDLTELVAEWGVHALALRNYKIDWYTDQFLQGPRKFYQGKDASFLPFLARMSLNEAVARQIVPLSD